MFEKTIEKILDLARPEIIEVEDREYILKGRDPAIVIYPDPIHINNLSGIIDYCSQDPEGIGTFMIHVLDYNQVNVYIPMGGPFNLRPVLVKSTCRSNGFEFGRQYDYESFLIAVHTCFVPNEDRDYILKFISSVRVDANSKVEDDGISQTLTAKMGVSSLVKDIPIKNILNLKPYRTFTEIDQPESVFVFRMKVKDNAPVFSVHEADGAAWKQEAVSRISGYVNNQKKNITAELSVIS